MERGRNMNQNTHSVYFHIPFCSNICSYCDFCKLQYYPNFVHDYLEALDREVTTVYQNEPIETIYIGGGTPSCLSLSELEKLFSIVQKIHLQEDYEFTFECNPEDLTIDKMKLLKENGVNRLSIGVESSHMKHQKQMGRTFDSNTFSNNLEMLKELGFQNINVDFIYALPNETLEDVLIDLEWFISLSLPHISLYSLQIEPHTKFYIEKIEPISEELDVAMYEAIDSTLEQHGYTHYEVSNYARSGHFSKHNLVYWNNEEYYGFGLGAGGYVNGVRYQNVKGLNSYIKGQYRIEEHQLLKNEQIENEFILGFRKMEGISIEKFEQKYKISLKNIRQINRLLKQNKLMLEDGFIKIPKPLFYISNTILVDLIGEDYDLYTN